MTTTMKLHFCCVLVLIMITTNAVVPSPIEETEGEKVKATESATTSTLPAAEVGQDQVTDEDVAIFLEDMRRLRSHQYTLPQSVPVIKPASQTPDSVTKTTTETPDSVTKTTTQSSDSSYEAVRTKFDVTISLALGVASAVLLVALAASVIAIFVCCKSGKSAKKDLVLNSDLNRWDPQLLRPNKADIDAFIFGSPIPSVTEMIKQ